MTHLLLAKISNCCYYISVGKCEDFKSLDCFICYEIETNQFIMSSNANFDMDTIISIFLQNYKSENNFFQKAYIEKDKKFHDKFEMYDIKKELLNIISNIIKQEQFISIYKLL